MSTSSSEFLKLQNFWRTIEKQYAENGASVYSRRSCIETNILEEEQEEVESQASAQVFGGEVFCDKRNNSEIKSNRIYVSSISIIINDEESVSTACCKSEIVEPSLLYPNEDTTSHSSECSGSADLEFYESKSINCEPYYLTSYNWFPCLPLKINQERSGDKSPNLEGTIDISEEFKFTSESEFAEDEDKIKEKLKDLTEPDESALQKLDIESSKRDSLSSDEISCNEYKTSSIVEPSVLVVQENNTEKNSDIKEDDDFIELDFLDDYDWLMRKTHIFILSSAGKPVFSLQGHGFENKMCPMFALIQSLISIIKVRKDRIVSIKAEGIKFVFLVHNSLYFVVASRENINEHLMQLQLSEACNRIGFLLTFEYLNRVFKEVPNYDLRKHLNGKFNMISNYLTTNIRISNNIFTLFTTSIRVLPLQPPSRTTLTDIIRGKCRKVKNLVFALLISDSQLITLVRLKNYSIHPADMRLIFNFLQCEEIKYGNLYMLPVCLPYFNKECFLFAYISKISVASNAVLVLLSCDRNMVRVMNRTHREISKTFYKSKDYKAICQQIRIASNDGIAFEAIKIKIPELWHFLYLPRTYKNKQLLCPKLIPPYTRSSALKRLESIYCDLHHRIHDPCNRLELIFEVKEKEVVVASITKKVEIYAVFDPKVNIKMTAKYYVDELVRWISINEDAFFIRKYSEL